jgi:mono/diheme cytochrome c family protein
MAAVIIQLVRIDLYMNSITFLRSLIGTLLTVGSIPLALASPLDDFRDNSTWKATTAASAVGDKLQIAPAADSPPIIVYNGNVPSESTALISNAYLGDSLLEMEYLVPGDAKAKLFLQGRYALVLDNSDNEWQSLSVKYRAPRFDEARNKVSDALALEVRINGEVTYKNILFPSVSSGAPIEWEDSAGPIAILANEGGFALRNFDVYPADFSAITPPEQSGSASNEDQLVDFVALGEDKFNAVGCNVCHSTESNATGKSGPTLYGLFTRGVREREVVEGGEGHRFTIKADDTYLHRSMREPEAQLAVAEVGVKKGEAYPPLMPRFPASVLSDTDIDAIGAYLATLNAPHNQGPVIKLVPAAGHPPYDPVKDDLQLLVGDTTRIQRGPMPGVSGRAIHVGQINGVNYSFDPRNLGITKLWQGGFLDMSGEFLNRGGKGLEIGYKSREINLAGQPLFAPLNNQGELIDFSFKSAKFGDNKTVYESLQSEQDHLDRVAAENAQFLGYEIDSKQTAAAPVFHYRIGENIIAVQTTIAADGTTRIEISGQLKAPQAFSFNQEVFQEAQPSTGEITGNRWRVQAIDGKALLTGRIGLASDVWTAPSGEFDYRQQPIKKSPAKAELPVGYRIESYYPPKDNFGRDQLFEALGIALAEDGTIVVATRTAGIWRIANGQWQLFAEGTFDTLGVQIEDKKGLRLIVGQKAELTRISDTNGDQVADKYETLFDAHSYHGNYHSYLHGPVRGGDGAYYIGINLAHAGEDTVYKAGGAYMGATGGFSGWSFRVEPDGDYTPWASGMRSPAGIGADPNGTLWYAENQGEFVGTSKLFRLVEDGFYGHPAGLVDLPGMTPQSPEIAWEKVAEKRERPVILFPHNRVANSPGNPAWDTTNGKFGAFAGQMLIGDQTQSNLLRVSTEIINGVEQGSVMPFVAGLESGVMRPLFMQDGSLLLGQTGRGWQAKGGHVASLQRIYWDGKTVAPTIHSVQATKTGFAVNLTQALEPAINDAQLKELVSVESWVYRDAPDYGSEELDLKAEAIEKVSISEDRKQVLVHLGQLKHAPIHPHQTARVYHLTLEGEPLFGQAAPARMEAYYTLYNFKQ